MSDAKVWGGNKKGAIEKNANESFHSEKGFLRR